MALCANCGEHYYDRAHFCSNCGKPIDGEHKKVEYSGAEPKSQHKQEKDKRCPYCNSTGKVDGPIGGDLTVTCPVCKGRRYNLIPEDWLKCSKCGSAGGFAYGAGSAYVRKLCPECKGAGWLES
jgi:DNA-directed RNA polymerase subunit RPC12/RpoP